MFMRYTHHGIGHPAVLRQITRDCTIANLADGQNVNGDWVGDIHSCEGDNENGGSDDGGGWEDDDDDDDDDDDEEGEEDGEDINERECDDNEGARAGVDDYDDWEMEDFDEDDEQDCLSF
jgi:hypothetical protein